MSVQFSHLGPIRDGPTLLILTPLANALIRTLGTSIEALAILLEAGRFTALTSHLMDHDCGRILLPFPFSKASTRSELGLEGVGVTVSDGTDGILPGLVMSRHIHTANAIARWATHLLHREALAVPVVDSRGGGGGNNIPACVNLSRRANGVKGGGEDYDTYNLRHLDFLQLHPCPALSPPSLGAQLLAPDGPLALSSSVFPPLGDDPPLALASPPPSLREDELGWLSAAWRLWKKCLDPRSGDL